MVGRLFLLHAGVLMLQASILVSGQLNSPPRLKPGSETYFQVSEGAAIGEVLFSLRATDSDAGDVLTFSALTDETRSLVDLGTPVKGSDGVWSCELLLKTQLDRDQGLDTRKLFFEVSDKSAQVSIYIMMIITDINDNPPTFLGLPYKTSIPEDFEVGKDFFTVSARDPDMGNGGSVEYTFETNRREFKETFDIHPYLGHIALNRSLDYEQRSFYHLKVSATDLGDQRCPGATCLCNASTTQCDGEPVDLFITVEDVQDTPPEFERLLNMYYVPENRNVGDAILQVQAVDGDRGVDVPNQIRYSFTTNNPNPFSIDEISGTISVKERLDAADPRSTGGLYILAVTATEVSPTGSSAPADIDPSRSTSQTNVSIIVTDVDDHAPQFNHLTYSANVLENTPSGAPLTVSPTIEVSDKDQGENSRFRISVKRNGVPYNGFTTLPGEGQIIQGSSRVTITVGDTTELDYETENVIAFQLVLTEEHANEDAHLPSRPPATATVVLNLSDANDNSPTFPPSQPRSFSVSEDLAPGEVIGTVTAQDADSGDFGNVTFNLEMDGHEEEFNISSEGVIRLAKTLDREVRSAYSLVVIATDSPSSPASQQRTSRLPITANVLDVNDLDPQWTLVIPVVSVQESALPDTKITDLIAVDRDQGLNGEIEYSIAPGTNGSTLFVVRKIDGRAELSVGSSLVGHSGLLVVKVKATDKGASPRTSEAEVTVLVIDENQFTPVFTNPDEGQYNVSTGELPEIIVDEEEPINTVLMQFKATDRDQGVNGEINYFLVPSLNKDFEFFMVDRETGYLRAARRLDREAKESYEIQVKAEDLGQPAARASILTMRVRLRDIDDHTPTFASQVMPLTMSVQEENNSANIGVVEASDADSELSNRGVCYYLFGGDFLSRLKLNKDTGNLSLKEKINRETTQLFDVVIKASPRCNLDPLTFVTPEDLADSASTATGGRSTSSSLATPPEAYNASDASLLWVRVTVLDVNDNPPQFSHQTLSTGILFDVPRDTEIMNLAVSSGNSQTLLARKLMIMK
ncbi:cadherin-23 [Elysia marginata]|uniref:Cadherin-23 n=1 Tax=Elysia marginata TaxID=1093978 RepID=A0AAV4F2J4_9GAST|nr:cadherin-23 [Elysia marginata]